LFERAVEAEVVAVLLDRLSQQRGGVVLFEASPGLGKSRLLDLAAERAASGGTQVFRANGHVLERSYAWGVMCSLFEGSVFAADEQQRARLLDGPAVAARQVFENAQGPAVESDVAFTIMHGLYWLALRIAQSTPAILIVDDAHWADEASLRCLAYLAGRVDHEPVGLLVATRPPQPPLPDVVGLLGAARSAQVRHLQALSADSVAALVRDRIPNADDRFIRRCYELTAGNPLYLNELLHAVRSQSVRPSLADLEHGLVTAARSLERSVGARLAMLSRDAQALACALAVLETEATVALAASMARLGTLDALAAADELVAAEMITAGDPTRFVHPMVQAAVYGSMPRAESAEQHRRAADLLVKAGVPMDRVCAHLLRTAPSGRAIVVEHLRTAARHALATGVPTSAVSYLERAWREPPSSDQRSGVLAELGRAEAVAGRPTAVRHLEEAVGLTDDPLERARLLLAFGRSQHHVGRLDEACVAFQQGLDEVDSTKRDEKDLRAALEGGYLNAAMFGSGHAAEAHARAERILDAADGLQTRAELALLSKAVMLGLWAGAPRDRLLDVTRRLVRTGALDDGDAADSQAAWQAIATLGWCDDHLTADTALRAQFAAARRHGSVLGYALACVFRARHALWTGPVADAVHDARAALDVLPAESVYVSSAGFCLVTGLLECDEVAAAEETAAGDHRADLPPFFRSWWDMATARVQARLGNHDRALAAFLAVGRAQAELRIENPSVLPWRSEAALAARALGDMTLARSLVAEELERAQSFGGPRPQGTALLAAGLLARGQPAVDLLRSAGDQFAAAGAAVLQAGCEVHLGAALRRERRREEARRVLRDAILLADQVGASRVASQGRAELALAGGRATAARQPDTILTPGERRVAELAAAGQSNRQIANALFVTVKAVEWHLGNAYRKLGIDGRGGLAEALSAIGSEATAPRSILG
jgi:DNA-binding CsgD family transcriptional regulator